MEKNMKRNFYIFTVVSFLLVIFPGCISSSSCKENEVEISSGPFLVSTLCAEPVEARVVVSGPIVTKSVATAPYIEKSRSEGFVITNRILSGSEEVVTKEEKESEDKKDLETCSK